MKKEIHSILERNKRVEFDKAWEISFTRKIIIAVFTYIVIVLFFLVANLPRPFINPIIPTVGFLLSTLTLPLFKDIWLRYVYKK
ncbi:hypothetical protein J4205_03720 [Candidatus Pacearchaeota archaeon]|nr:hypothetical protein [Candidatus Pacearchaeota archaeon]